jgi:hypothetical protein
VEPIDISFQSKYEEAMKKLDDQKIMYDEEQCEDIKVICI